MYNLGFVVFTIGSLLCGISTNGSQLVAFRVLQGVGGAFIASNSGAIIADTFPMKERGKAFGITGMGFSIGANHRHLDRRGVRHLPQLALHILHQSSHRNSCNDRRVLLAQGALAAEEREAGLRRRHPVRVEPVPDTLLHYEHRWLRLDLIVWARADRGILYLRRFRPVGAALILPVLGPFAVPRRSFAASSFAAFFQSLANYAVIFLVIMYLQGPRGMSPWDASLLLIPGYILGGLIAPLSGRLSDRHGARVIGIAWPGHDDRRHTGLFYAIVGLVRLPRGTGINP